MKRAFLFAAVGNVLCATDAGAQSVLRRSPYDALAPGHRKIAQALFLARRHLPTTSWRRR